MKKNQIIGVAAGLVLVVAAVVIFANSGKSSSNTSTKNNSASSSSAVATNTVAIKNYMFGPMTIKIKIGTTVTWTNMDSVNHTVSADTPSADAPTSMDIAQGKSYSYTFKKVGTYTYHCFPHPYMHGSVVVTN